MSKKFTVTPWKVEGDIDYNRLIKEFGTEPLTDELLARLRRNAGGELHHFLRRKIFFSHRDLKWLLDEYEKGNKFYLYTGRGPSGNTHIGHLIPWIFTKWLQDRFDAELWFQLTDDEKFLFNEKLTMEETNRMAYENALDIIALGFRQGKTFIFSDLDYSKTLYRQALKVAKKLTVSTAKAVFGFKDSDNVGEVFFTSVQSVPAFLPSVLKGRNVPCLIPYAIDQDAHFRVTRDITPKLGYYKPAAIHCRFLPPLTGPGGKMSASVAETAVYTTDPPETVERKIRKYAFSGGRDTISEHRKKGGNPDVDVSYQWLTFFEENDEKLKKIHDDYVSGALLTGELKQILIDKLTAFLKRHQENREKARKVLDRFVLKD
ncbi:tryptophan--tRNA ligase [Candidatus Woesearchaeota archaeon]|nr:tryptophan--tRNA ligase [Candidatus Woesearchaeota archaeon]